MALVNNPTPRYGALGGRGGFPLAQTGAGFLAQRGGLLSGVNPQVANQPLATPVDPGVLPPLVPPANVPGTDVPPNPDPQSNLDLPHGGDPTHGGNSEGDLNPNHPAIAPPLQAPPPPPGDPNFSVRYVPGLTPAPPLPTAPGTSGGNLDTLTNGSHSSTGPEALAGRPDPFATEAPGQANGPVPDYGEPPVLPQYGGDVNAFRSYYGMAPLQNNPGTEQVNPVGRSLGISGGPTGRTGPVRETNPNDNAVAPGTPGGNLLANNPTNGATRTGSGRTVAPPPPAPVGDRTIQGPTLLSAGQGGPYNTWQQQSPGQGVTLRGFPSAQPRQVAAPNPATTPMTNAVPVVSQYKAPAYQAPAPTNLPPNDMGNSATAGVGASTQPVARTLGEDPNKARRR